MRRHIRNIKVGDKVKVYNVDDNTFSVSKVSKLFKHSSDHYYLLNDTLKVTGTHPFYVKDNSKEGYSWVEVKDLKFGDKLFTKKGKIKKLRSIKKVDNPLIVYNMEVEGQHNYFAGGFLVHNKGSFLGGDYHGKDTQPKAARNEVNKSLQEWNQNVPDAGSSALETAFAEGRSIVQDIEGIASSVANTSTGEPGETSTGEESIAEGNLTDTLFDALESAREARVGAKMDAGQALREGQEAIANTLNLSGVIGPVEAQQDKLLAQQETQVRDAQKEFNKESIKARADFQEGVDTAVEGLQSSDAFNEFGSAVQDAKQSFAIDFKAGKERFNNMDNFDPRRKNLEPASRGGTGNSTMHIGTNMAEFQTQGLDDILRFDDTWSAQPDATATDITKEVNTVKNRLNRDIQMLQPNTSQGLKEEIHGSIASIWGGQSGGPIAGLKGDYGTTVGSTGDANSYVGEHKCFSGNTFIEVVE